MTDFKTSSKMFGEEKPARLTIILPRFEKHLTICCHKLLTLCQTEKKNYASVTIEKVR